MGKEKFEAWLDHELAEQVFADMARARIKTKSEYTRRTLVLGLAMREVERDRSIALLGLGVNHLTRLLKSTAAGEGVEKLEKLAKDLRALVRQLQTTPKRAGGK
ncbi:hypothetical protein KUV65_06685 [Maritalea mobilis]|uniref:hypothetical protein n=1 Tax=Maritalea mobilis TaxID=483324 RepID=UPI001C94D2A7|nr:hypothetical protein [Maritalea mobilis]MBY6201040.1 hypothetical protein [Maritalea mobilis]